MHLCTAGLGARSLEALLSKAVLGTDGIVEAGLVVAGLAAAHLECSQLRHNGSIDACLVGCGAYHSNCRNRCNGGGGSALGRDDQGV